MLLSILKKYGIYLPKSKTGHIITCNSMKCKGVTCFWLPQNLVAESGVTLISNENSLCIITFNLPTRIIFNLCNKKLNFSNSVTHVMKIWILISLIWLQSYKMFSNGKCNYKRNFSTYFVVQTNKVFRVWIFKFCPFYTKKRVATAPHSSCNYQQYGAKFWLKILVFP